MPHSDRTAEFRTVAKSFQVENGQNYINNQIRAFQMKIHAQNGRVNNMDGREKLIQSSIQFNQLAKCVSFYLYSLLYVSPFIDALDTI